jgi:hypothetical protein
VHSPSAPWMWKNQWSRYSHEPWGSTVPISSLLTKIKKKGMKAFNALVYSSNLMVVNDRRSSDRISSIDRYLFFESSRDSATSVPLQSLCTQGATSSEIFKKVSLWGGLSRVSSETDKGVDFSRNNLNSELIQCAYIHINLFINIIHMWPFHSKHATTISE